jgi:hypothetical protein
LFSNTRAVSVTLAAGQTLAELEEDLQGSGRDRTALALRNRTLIEV